MRDSKPGPQSDAPELVLITGGAGYIGSLLTGVLLQRGFAVTVVDDLLFGGESILAYFSHPNFHFIKGDVCDPSVLIQICNLQSQGINYTKWLNLIQILYIFIQWVVHHLLFFSL